MTQLPKADKALQEKLDQLHKLFVPHDGQKAIARALFLEEVKDIFVEAGRSFGKTRIVSYCLWRWAMTFPNSENYYFAPYMKQAREILWASRTIQSIGPNSWLQSEPNNTEMRVTFKNNSFIKLDGSDNFEAYRGIKPKGLIIYDEFKDFRPEFFDAFDPNRGAHNAPLMVIGTPPEQDGLFFTIADEFKANPKKRYFWAPSERNPYLSKEWLDQKKSELYARGDGDVWEREYMAKRVKGGKRSIFPMFSNRLIVSHETLINTIKKDRHQLEWYAVADPGTITVFAVLFAAINRYTGTVYLLDEIYEQTEANTTVTKIVPKMLEIMEDLLPYQEARRDEWLEKWFLGYDEAASWFAAEALDRYGLAFHPTKKSLHNKEQGLNAIRDLMLTQKLVLSDRCNKLAWECENYVKDSSGKIPKSNDHLNDCLRYMLHLSGYTSQLENIPDQAHVELDARERRLLEIQETYSSDTDSFDSEYLEGLESY
jgi:hypothetical protein